MDNAFFFCVNNKKSALSLSFSPAAWHNENRKDIHGYNLTVCLCVV